ncbi:metallophosphoesterase [Loigolactobacillus binensis]|uniref:Metallophosphoesterase n=1 Tax=Loigolactobacillus binensis TaxID=2559922 RepID=A0ABW3EDP1_9LACO|nr:metallophosphoesterase [Loigolactobacillus binensis]
MRKVAMTSDNHFDINRVDIAAVVAQQVTYLLTQQVTDYLIAGDLFNDFRETVAYVEQMAQQLQPHCRVFFIAGNHDMVRGTDFSELQSRVNTHYAHQKLITFPGTDYVLIGNNGWYDYQFAQLPGKTMTDFAHWKKAFWIDGVIEQPLSDPERMDLVLATTEKQLRQAKAQHKKVLFMTHFVPQDAYIIHQQRALLETGNAYMGSPRLGALLQQYQVAYVLFGHTHFKYPPHQIAGTTYLCRPVGYGTKRRHEWRFGRDFISEWRACLQILDLT